MSDTPARPRLLIIDDDPAICQLIADIANIFDYVTDIASTPDEIARYVGGGHDLVMLDLSLGETDGMRVMRDLGERQPGANLVLLTGADTSVLQSAARVAELSGFHLVGACGKPASIQELEAVLRPQQHEPKPVAAADDLRTTVLRALDDGALYLLYQPIVDLRTGLVCRVEALVRLDVPGANQISPEKWVPIIEADGRSIDLLEVVLRHAAFDRASVPALAALDNISINLSVLDLAHLDLPERAESILGAAASPERWTLEITETAEVGKLADALDVLIRLRLKGFWLDMDDFGSGSSTLHRLRELPFTGVKADRRFVTTDFGDTEQHAVNMLRAAVDLGAALGLKVVAEGVETAEEIELARSVGCDFAQGYFIGRPVRAESLGVLVASWNQLDMWRDLTAPPQTTAN
jgi:EAL domain-containing protein (putative c-di-GMP-specific phosphodiesterase class I)/ActR/RegA family two-component response regulator